MASAESSWLPLSVSEVVSRSIILSLQGMLSILAVVQLFRLRIAAGGLFNKTLSAKKLFHVWLLLAMGLRTANNIYVLGSPCYRKENGFTPACYIVNVATIRLSYLATFLCYFTTGLFWSEYAHFLRHRKEGVFFRMVRVPLIVLTVVVVSVHAAYFVMLFLWVRLGDTFFAMDMAMLLFVCALFLLTAVLITWYALRLTFLVYHLLSPNLLRSAVRVAVKSSICSLLLLARCIWTIAVVIPNENKHTKHMWPSWKTAIFQVLEMVPLIVMADLMWPMIQKKQASSDNQSLLSKPTNEDVDGDDSFSSST